MAVTAEAISAAYTRDIVMVCLPGFLKNCAQQKCFAVRIVGETGKFPFKGNH
jgi:hypothetical protein